MGCSRGRSRWLHSSDVQTQGGAYSAEREAENEPTGSRESGDLLPVQSGPLHKLQHNYRFYHIVVSLNTHLSLWTRAVVTLTYLTGSKNACRTSLMQTPRVVCQIYFCTWTDFKKGCRCRDIYVFCRQNAVQLLRSKSCDSSSSSCDCTNGFEYVLRCVWGMLSIALMSWCKTRRIEAYAGCKCFVFFMYFILFFNSVKISPIKWQFYPFWNYTFVRMFHALLNLFTQASLKNVDESELRHFFLRRCDVMNTTGH